MKLYLVQHGEAESKKIDPERPLTEHGRQNTELMAEMAAKLDLGVHEIRHSGKTRAEQTAAIFGEALSPKGGVVAVSGLNPMDDVRPVADEMAGKSEAIMLVGHLPFMPRLAGQLVYGNPETDVVAFRNSGIACLIREGQAWRVMWHLTPG